MVTRFKLKKDAEAFVRELEDRFGVGVFHRIYKGHRDFCVQHNDEAKNCADDVTTTAAEG